MKSVFAGIRENNSLSLTELLGENENLSLEEIIDMCADDLVRNLHDEESSFTSDHDDQHVGDDWEYEDWTIEWEGRASFSNYEEPDTNYGESNLTDLVISRAEAWQGDDFASAQDVTAQLQAALDSYLNR